jgi:two-component system NtrC family sensor kinase
MNPFKRSLGLHQKLLLILTVGTLFVVSIASLAVLIYETTTFRPKMTTHLTTVANVMADINQATLEFNDANLAQDNLSFLRLYEGIQAGALYRIDGSQFAAWKANSAQVTIPAKLSQGIEFTANKAEISIPVTRDERTLGYLWISLKLPSLLSRLPQYQIMFFALGLAILILGVILFISTKHIITEPIHFLSKAAKSVGQTNDFSVQVPKNSNDEIGELTDEFNRMLFELGARDLELKKVRDSLEERVIERSTELEHAMTLLMNNEKLAALGNIVAGVAHELNTPLGNALLSVSTLSEDIKKIAEHSASNTLKRSELVNFIVAAEALINLINKNIERSASLVRSFKSVAVNEVSEARMHFNLKQVLDDSLALNMPSHKHKPIRFYVQCDEHIECNSYPGAVTQIVSNLVENSIRHGLNSERGGDIHILIERINEDNVQMSVADNGHGIAPEHIQRIFEPFFTTKFGQGGSGLGLHIVHNLVVHTLCGSIQVHSKVGEGTRFDIQFPIHTPVKGIYPDKNKT